MLQRSVSSLMRERRETLDGRSHGCSNLVGCVRSEGGVSLFLQGELSKTSRAQIHGRRASGKATIVDALHQALLLLVPAPLYSVTVPAFLRHALSNGHTRCVCCLYSPNREQTERRTKRNHAGETQIGRRDNTTSTKWKEKKLGEGKPRRQFPRN